MSTDEIFLPPPVKADAWKTCPQCRISAERCEQCGALIKIYDLVDIFHEAYCLACRTWTEKWCPARMDERYFPAWKLEQEQTDADLSEKP